MDQVAASSASQLISLNGKPAVSFNQGFDIAWRRVWHWTAMASR
jgi:hypothetical protein